jgi:hypothetical protein
VWVFQNNLVAAYNCAQDCALACAGYARNNPKDRVALCAAPNP